MALTGRLDAAALRASALMYLGHRLGGLSCSATGPELAARGLHAFPDATSYRNRGTLSRLMNQPLNALSKRLEVRRRAVMSSWGRRRRTAQLKARLAISASMVSARKDSVRIGAVRGDGDADFGKSLRDPEVLQRGGAVVLGVDEAEYAVADGQLGGCSTEGLLARVVSDVMEAVAELMFLPGRCPKRLMLRRYHPAKPRRRLYPDDCRGDSVLTVSFMLPGLSRRGSQKRRFYRSFEESALIRKRYRYD